MNNEESNFLILKMPFFFFFDEIKRAGLGICVVYFQSWLWHQRLRPFVSSSLSFSFLYLKEEYGQRSSRFFSFSSLSRSHSFQNVLDFVFSFRSRCFGKKKRKGLYCLSISSITVSMLVFSLLSELQWTLELKVFVTFQHQTLVLIPILSYKLCSLILHDITGPKSLIYERGIKSVQNLFEENIR